jgi:hypothetical protein
VNWVYAVLAFLAIAGAAFAAAFAALERWVAFFLFLAVFVIGVTALTVQVVLNT